MNLTAEAAIQRAQVSLRNAGVDGPRREARLLVALATGAERSLAADARLTPEAQGRLAALVARRAAREPYAYLAEEREFMGLRFTVSRAALIPRPETESLIEALLEDQPAQHVLDLGTGTGAMLLSLLDRWRGARGVGVDRSPAALAVARHNADALGFRGRALLLASDWGSALRPDPAFDLAVCNPPYIPSDKIGGLDPEVRDYEPRLALDGGSDGLDPVRALLPGLVRVLALGARAVFETDPRLWDGLAELVSQSGGADIACLQDLTGRRRGLVARFAGTRE
ncbi:MAG: peptide chain release factor N(5)-glutamine methyltransferase [Rhodospirillales bacterium]|nr:peptide chain release factor N(5)-glutamine methyltransferase [Rhodospirillales bacterium]